MLGQHRQYNTGEIVKTNQVDLCKVSIDQDTGEKNSKGAISTLVYRTDMLCSTVHKELQVLYRIYKNMQKSNQLSSPWPSVYELSITFLIHSINILLLFKER